MSNIVTGLFNSLKFAFENPLFTLLIVIGILLMPLAVFNFLLFIIANFLVVIINVIYWILVFLVNLIIIVINLGIVALFDILSFLVGSITAPQLELFVFEQQPYLQIEIFDSNTNLLMIILEALGI